MLFFFLLTPNHISDKEAFGNDLADYVDSGRGIVLTTFYWNVSWGGRLATDGYSPLTFAGQDFKAFLQIGSVFEPDHPVMSGVGTFCGGSSSYRNTGTFVQGAIPIAEWEDGRPFAAEMPGFNGRIIGLNFYPPSSDCRDDFWDVDTDGDILLANALAYVVRQAPCEADCNSDGSIDILDYLCFQGLITSGDVGADCDADGHLNVFDFLCFQGLVSQGCG